MTRMPVDTAARAGDGRDRLATAVMYRFHLTVEGAARFTFVSETCADLYGFAAEEAMRDADLMHEAIRVGQRAGFAAAGQVSLRTLQPLHWDGTIVRPDGHDVPVTISSRPRRLEDGSTEWYGVVASRAEAPARPGADRATSSGRESAVVQMIGHDFAGPLTAIVSYAELAADALPRTGDETPRGDAHAYVRRCLEVIERQGRRLDEMRRDLVALALSEGDALRARPEVVAVRPYLLGSAELVRLPLRVRIVCADDVRCVVQPSHLTQILGNLVSNASRFARASVTLSVEVADGLVQIRVEDDGPGVAFAVVDRLFSPFTHVGGDGTSPLAGTGLGLHIARTLAVANDGTLLHDDAAAGGCFTVQLPAAARATPS